MILAEIGAENFLEKEGFPVAKKVIIQNKNELSKVNSIGFPCVMKISSSEATHKAVIGGVKIVYNKSKLKSYFSQFEKIAKKVNGKIMVQKFEDGKELLVGLKKDPVFGHVLLFGVGGSNTEAIKDIQSRIVSNIKEKGIKDMIKSIKNYKMIEKCNIDSISKILGKMVNLSKKHPEIKELDINPLIVNEKRAVIVDARILN